MYNFLVSLWETKIWRKSEFMLLEYRQLTNYVT